jgi:tetratricopeptide (TPR) repeat protein
VIWDERTKTFKGEPYERATAYFYRGICHFNRNDYSGALAAFRSSLAADAETRNKERKYLEDFTISHFMAALCYERLGEHDNTKTSLEMAQSASPKNPFLSVGSLEHNFVAILGVGSGPFKMGARKFSAGPCPEQRVEVIVDSDSPKTASEATDLLVQAQSQRRGSADKARIARQTGKFCLSVTLSALSGSNVEIKDYEDTRSWWGLPLKFYLFTADIPPGNHTVMVKCYDAKGSEIEQDRQLWFDVPVPSGNAPVLLLVIRPYWQNHQGLKQVKITN